MPITLNDLWKITLERRAEIRKEEDEWLEKNRPLVSSLLSPLPPEAIQQWNQIYNHFIKERKGNEE